VFRGKEHRQAFQKMGAKKHQFLFWCRGGERREEVKKIPPGDRKRIQRPYPALPIKEEGKMGSLPGNKDILFSNTGRKKGRKRGDDLHSQRKKKGKGAEIVYKPEGQGSWAISEIVW